MIFNLIILYFKSLINHIYLPWVMCFDTCLFIHFRIWMVVVEKIFHNTFNMAKSRGKRAVLVIFLKIKYLLFYLSLKQPVAVAVCLLLHTSHRIQLSRYYPTRTPTPHSHRWKVALLQRGDLPDPAMWENRAVGAQALCNAYRLR